MKTNKLSMLGVVAATVVVAGCATAPNTVSLANQAPLKTSAEMAQPFTLGAGDVIEVRVWRAPELSVSGPIRSDGMFAMPLIGTLDVAGRTPEQVKAEVEDKLAEFVASPEATVIVSNTNSDEFTNRVRVTGAVDSQISVPWREDMTVLDLVLLAGGTNDFAAPQKTTLFRKTADGVVAYPVMLQDILEAGELATNYALQPSDILTIPEANF